MNHHVRRALGAVAIGALWVACSSADSPGDEDTGELELPIPGLEVDGGTTTASSTSNGSGGTATASSTSNGSGAGTSTGATGAGGGGGAAPCSCPVGAGEYLPPGVENPCPAETERTSCQSEMCTVAIGDPNDNIADFHQLRACKFPPPPAPPPGPCSCPVGPGEYLPDDTSTNECPDPSNTNRNSCQWDTCKVMIGDPSDGLVDAIAIRQCSWPPPPPNPIGPCMCPVGAGEYLPDGDSNDCPDATTAGACGASWCTVAIGDPSDSQGDFWQMRPCGWNVPISD